MNHILLFDETSATNLLQSYVHDTDEDRAEYFQQWARQLDKETTTLREAVRTGIRAFHDAVLYGASTCHDLAHHIKADHLQLQECDSRASASASSTAAWDVCTEVVDGDVGHAGAIV